MKILTVSLLIFAFILLTSAEFCTIDGAFPKCPRGWKEFHGRCFLLVQTAMTWAKAEKNCLTMNANLASIHSADEKAMIKTYIAGQLTTVPDTWIGLSDCVLEATYLWTDGSTKSVDYWCATQPNTAAANTDDCIMISKTTGDCWFTKPCSESKASLCVKKVKKTA